MFTGLVSDVGEVLSVEERGDVRRLRIACAYPAASIALGASIACSGPCLTAVAVGEAAGRTWFDIDAGWETLDRTTLGTWTANRKINLERSLKIGDELGGHLVSGHVDGLATVVGREDLGTTVRFTLEAPAPLARFIAEKGSVSLDGTSLTVNGVEGSRFTVLLIPHTLAVTTWGDVAVGDQLNLEVDQMARYAARLADTAASGQGGSTRA
ncbi:riboflavin synthase [Lichenihabitans sp. Uapishka_5]|uniref:riboflavin synthase n=1 Tax=Lichenihabitans sp. Uapishka_5 TaxID=3037302 RepID=UPI0029E828ED|nr:riboflavin synthase [Lichenihabitans sp. Uapishka_5]MDX7950917.1 riboflavin synthase [Lichenihabitans sp. Uapishka_5]